MRYLFTISGHLEVDAPNETEAIKMVTNQTVTHFDKDKKIFVIVTTASYKPFHIEEN